MLFKNKRADKLQAEVKRLEEKLESMRGALHTARSQRDEAEEYGRKRMESALKWYNKFVQYKRLYDETRTKVCKRCRIFVKRDGVTPCSRCGEVNWNYA